MYNNNYYNRNRNQNRNFENKKYNSTEEPKKKIKLDDLNFAEEAENVIKDLLDEREQKTTGVSTSQIRNILSMSNNIYNKVIEIRSEKLPDDIQSDFQYMKMKLAYAAGRDKNVGRLILTAQLREQIDEIKDSREKAMIFFKYMESLVAYHKFYEKKKTR